MKARCPGRYRQCGGFVDWTAQLLGNRKERLLISGHGLDRLAILTAQP
jgi:hypothetical protein